ncbi:sensor histidine kinase [uncultured Aquimarina sp.]|uniref:sensor histidine kinase n=1 Tax=uncultured Aquimarina sp. TaxID=575652 RepID=UPI00262861B0|nr:sensor histidine kinase [uncultured Aquimarina sp.]
MPNNDNLFNIKPAARLITTIGEDLIGDSYAAIIELVKNSFDADASDVNITFEYEDEALLIEILDDGHGMSRETILTKWLVPATDNKLKEKTSPSGRNFQGRKGIGRYAAAILGQKLKLNSIDKTGESTNIEISWEVFEKEEFLEDVLIEVISTKTQERPTTKLIIEARGEKREVWGRPELSKLTRELRKLKSPILSKKDDKEIFNINLAFINCPFEEYNNQIFEIEALPISDFFDYKISGDVDSSGNLNAIYENNYDKNSTHDKISFQIKLKNDKQYCGPIKFDFRVFDRDPEAISNLIDKGLIDPITKFAIGKREARLMLDDAYGVNLYREKFRIRPYGNGGIDWLNLDKRRIQNPSFRISNNQVIGFIEIMPEEISGLREKSARDGLKEDSNYFGLVEILQVTINELESRRFNYRKKTGKGRKKDTTKKELEELFDFESLSKDVSKKLDSLKADDNTINEIKSLIKKEAEKKSLILNNIQKTIAIYQGQATLGKVVTVLLHEGRKPVSYFKQQSPNLSRWLKHYKAKGDWSDEIYDDILDRLENYKEQSTFLSDLFKRLDPLAKQNKGDKKDFSVLKAIDKAAAIFKTTFEENSIEFNLKGEENLLFKGWEEDMIIIFTNLIENSIYWLNEIEDKKQISIYIEDSKKDIIVHYKDNGLGISKDDIESAAIFNPGFSKKINGTGLGLPIAGESAERLNGIILAHDIDNGAYFTLEIRK